MKNICYHNLCVNWEDNNCLLDSVSHDHHGICISCVDVIFDKKELGKLREKQRKIHHELKRMFPVTDNKKW